MHHSIWATALLFSTSLAASCRSQHQSTFIDEEIQYLASLKSRLTGSPQQNKLINHIESELHCLGLEVSSSTWPFPYYDGPKSAPKLTVDGKDIKVASYGARSGTTGPHGVSGELVNLFTSSETQVPQWHLAKDKIAVTNITNIPFARQDFFSVWPGSPNWTTDFGMPEFNAGMIIVNLTNAADAGVKGVVYVWQNATGGLMEGQFTPFRELFQGVPMVFTQGKETEQTLMHGSQARLTLDADVKLHWPTRTIWTVVEGTQVGNESVIITTHTDGVNAVEENGHILLLLKAAELAASRPRRTTILVFVSGHMQEDSFSPAPGSASNRWLAENPHLWAGNGNRHSFHQGGQLKAVASSCVEHLGAVHWDESVPDNTYTPSKEVEPELLYASTSQLNSILRQHWQGANPNVTRITNPYTSPSSQVGEGTALFLADIPNFSLETNPSYLLKVWPKSFDEAQLIDKDAFVRQSDSFLKVWDMLDKMDPGLINGVAKDGLVSLLYQEEQASS